MKESFIHYIWNHKKFNLFNLKTTNNESIEIISVGQPNTNSGPDFFNSKIRINNQLWVGNVEIHINASDWFVHNHEKDQAYDNVILHVVWNDDIEVFRTTNTKIATLEIKEYVNQNLLNNYNELLHKKTKNINCSNQIFDVDDFTLSNWLERLFYERLERKSEEIFSLLKQSKNNWEAVLYKMLLKNFGLQTNKDAFIGLSNAIDFFLIRKNQAKVEVLEALLYGQSNLLNDTVEDEYYQTLKNEYQYISKKYKLETSSIALKFHRMRPANFPTIRLSQFANLYHQHHNLFSEIIKAKSKEELYIVFSVQASSYWKTHYTFGKESKSSAKKLSKSFIDLLIINTIVPVLFSYQKYNGSIKEEFLISLAQSVKPESNSIVKTFKDLKLKINSAMQSQSFIQLKTEYCNKNKCLQCAIGNKILNRNM